ncbi:MAG: Lrp/AsnC family transcriptional regulator [Nocardioidaceae bacterium]|nr:Lrp/AsnC family transcriptional regulator [Nocardioidaceae bacterium]
MDALDRQIMGVLLVDGRATYKEIGDEVGLSAPAVKRRVDKLLASGEISGFTAVIDPHVLGWHTEAYVEISYKGNVPNSRLTQDLERIPQVVGVWSVSGEADALVHVMATTMADVEQAVEQMRKTQGVDRTRSAIVMSRLLERPRT